MFAQFPAFQSLKTSLHSSQTVCFQPNIQRLKLFMVLPAAVLTLLFFSYATCFGQAGLGDREAPSSMAASDPFAIEASESTEPDSPTAAELDTTSSSNLSDDQRLGKLPTKVRREYERRIVPALEADNPQGFLLVVSDFISRHDPAIVTEIASIAESQGFGSIQKKFTAGSIRAIEQGIQVRPKRMADTLIEYLTQGMLEHAELETAELDQFSKTLNRDPDESWRDAEQRYWEIHVWKNRLENTGRVIGYAVELNQNALKKATVGADQAKIFELQMPIRALGSFKTRFQKLREREAELRVADLVRAEQVLQQSTDFEQTLNAAFALEIHGAELAEFFREYAAEKMISDTLKDPALIEKCESLLASGRSVGGSTIEKALLLRTGAHWWLRGRYGAAALSNGLLKPQLAMQNVGLMVGLFMPKQRPQAIGDYSTESDSFAPGYDRRHFYTWAVEQREITFSQSTETDRSVAKEKVGGDTANTFW